MKFFFSTCAALRPINVSSELNSTCSLVSHCIRFITQVAFESMSYISFRSSLTRAESELRNDIFIDPL